MQDKISTEAADKIRQILKRFEERFAGQAKRAFFFAETLRLLSFGLIRINPVNMEAQEQRDRFARLLEEFDPNDKLAVSRALGAIQQEFPSLYSPFWQLEGSFWYPVGSLYGEIRELEALLHQSRHQVA